MFSGGRAGKWAGNNPKLTCKSKRVVDIQWAGSSAPPGRIDLWHLDRWLRGCLPPANFRSPSGSKSPHRSSPFQKSSSARATMIPAGPRRYLFRMDYKAMIESLLQSLRIGGTRTCGVAAGWYEAPRWGLPLRVSPRSQPLCVYPLGFFLFVSIRVDSWLKNKRHQCLHLSAVRRVLVGKMLEHHGFLLPELDPEADKFQQHTDESAQQAHINRRAQEH